MSRDGAIATGNVWIVTCDDGNVCCPADEIVAVFTTEALAKDWVERQRREPGRRTGPRITNWILDEEINRG